MNRFLKYWRLTGRGEAFHAHVVAYADDFVILSRGSAAEVFDVDKSGDDAARRLVNEVYKTLAEECSARALRLPRLRVRTSPLQKRRFLYLSASPSKKSVQRLKAKVGSRRCLATTIRGPKCATG